MIRVIIADDHAIVRTGLAALLATAPDIELVGMAADGREAVWLVAAHRPDVALVDLSMPVLDGVEATRAIVAAGTSRVVVLTSLSDDSHIAAALDAGAIGYVLKHSEPDVLLDALRAAAAGDSPLDPKAARVALGARATKAVDATMLSAREQEVLRLVAGGLPNKQIPRRLGIAERTVKSHLTNVYGQLGLSDRTRPDEEHWFNGCFHELRTDELIVQTFTYEGFPDGVALERLQLEDLGDGRTRLVATSLVDSFESRDAFVASGMETGIVEGYERLDELLAR